MSTKSLLLASVAYICAGIIAGGLLATGNASNGNPDGSRETVKAAMPVPNTEAKRDRLTVAEKVASAMATAERWRESARLAPAITGSVPQTTTALAWAAEPTSPSRDKIGPPTPFVSQPPIVAAKPAAPPKKQGAYALLSDEQIASVKERMKLTPSQQAHWPAIETALRKIAKKLQKTNPTGADQTPAIDPDSPEVQDLKSAAMPLLFTLSEDQKREVRTLARVIGLNAVASAI